jgi:hypothetical protein
MKALEFGRSETALVAVLCLLFDLSRSEGGMLGQLLLHDCCDSDGLRMAGGCDGQPLTIGTMRVILTSLRRKLKHYDVQITCVAKVGYGLAVRDRKRIYAHLTEHDPTIIPERPRPQSQLQYAE